LFPSGLWWDSADCGRFAVSFVAARFLDMKFITLVTALASFCMLVSTQQVNRSLTNGWGSTPPQRHYINASQALNAINAGADFSNSIGVPNNIAVVDPSGQLVAFLRMDNAFLGSLDISIKKAKTVALFNGLFPSSGLLQRSQPGGDLFGIEGTNGGLVCGPTGVRKMHHVD
jgi:uncharacterized protein GlcG (DUF336 family)